MARLHRRAGAAITITTTLPSEHLATICQQAADQAKAKLDAATPGVLTFSFRGTRTLSMTFKLRLTEITDGTRQLASAITHYKTRQSTYLGIPVGPKRMQSLRAYENFMTHLSDLTRHADPDATIAITS